MSGFTRNERRRIRARSVGDLDDGRRAFPVHKNDTEAMARAIFEAWDQDLVMGEQTFVDWCPHTDQYRFDHGCENGWCERPVPRFVWTAAYPAVQEAKGER